MNWVKGFALVTCLATPLPVILATAAAATPNVAPAAPAATNSMVQKIATGEAEKRAKAADCSKQADAKKLHGEERRKFRDACKKS